MHAISAADLSKAYRTSQKEPGLRGALRDMLRRQATDRTAVDRVSFTVEAGELVGFLGPNGAGKTTTMKLLCGLLHPTSGSAAVLGHAPHRREPALLRRIALVMGQRSSLSWDLPAMETLLLLRDIYAVPDQRFRRTVGDLAEMLDVARLLRVPVRQLSLGERMKLELVAALAHGPEVLFLDEPTIGLDVVAQQRVRDFLRDLCRGFGTTILLTSHAMADIEALCPRVLLIDGGRLRFDGPLARLSAEADPRRLLTVSFAEPPGEAALAGAPAAWRVGRGDDPRTLRMAVPREQVGDATALALGLGRVLDLTVGEPPLEDVVRALFRSEGVRP